MDQTSPSSSMAGAINPMASLTTIHLAFMAVLALIVLVGIWWGMVLARRRRRAARLLEERQQAAEQGTPGSTQATGNDEIAPDPQAAAESQDVTAAAPAVAASSRPVAGDDQALTQLKGLGPKLVAALADRGITRIDQIAALTPAEAEALDADLGPFKGRMARDRWIEQAKLLSAGDRAGYEAAFGKLGG